MGQATSPTPAQPARTILVVDDDPDIVGAFIDLLTEHGYQVEVAKNGAEAIAILERGVSPCLILLDLMMPRVHGWAVLDALAGATHLAQTPVVITTAFEHAARPIRRAAAVVRKPIDQQMLLALVAKHAKPA
jgi:CheY-like chemotaxis protein